MSYDLQVFAPRDLTAEGMRALIDDTAGLRVDSHHERWLTVTRGARRRYCFTVDGPDQLEPEDVPPGVTGSVLGTRYLYTITVEGSADADIPHALRFGKRLAKVLDGALVDQQTDEIWSRSQSRKIRKPTREERVDVVALEWFSLRDDVPADPAALLISTAERYLPEALPRRFGEHEPFQDKYADVGKEGFSRAWREATSTLHFAGTGVCDGGRLNAGPNEQFPERFWSMSMTLLADPLRDPGWREAARQFFIALAGGLNAFYASAQVCRNLICSGRTLSFDWDAEIAIRPLRYRQGWLGLTPVPTWWSWFGVPYGFAASHLPRDGVIETAEGTYFESSEEPAARDALVPLSRWLPEELFSRLGPNPQRQRPDPLIPAAQIPQTLV
jgi:hypothetical protein